MITHVLIQLWRNLVHKPVYSLITFLGFTLGITAFLLIYLWISHELSYEKFHPGYDRIYRVLTVGKEGDEVITSAGSYRPLSRSLKMTFPQIEYATYLSYSSEDSPLQRKTGGEKIEARRVWTNEDFFQVFGGFRFVEGTPEEAFDRPSNIVLSEETARKLFRDEPALGKTLISDKYDTEILTVGGVIRIPPQSHIHFGFIQPETAGRYAHLAGSWGDKAHVRTYIRLKPYVNIDEEIRQSLTHHLKSISPRNELLAFQRIANIHLHTTYPVYLYDHHISHSKYVWIFSGLALLIILMASLNFSLLSVARASDRSTEIGIRKVSGADQRSIIRHFLGEAVIQTMLASLLALSIVGLILPWFNAITHQQLSFQFSVGSVLLLILCTGIIGIVSGLYPALFMARQQPVSIFRGGSITGSNTGFLFALVIIQFAVAIFFSIATVVVMKQLRFMQQQHMGSDNGQIVVVPTGLWYGNDSFKEELLRNPAILGVSASTQPPVDFSWQGRMAVLHGSRIDTIRASLFWVDEDFAKTYDLEMVRGEFLNMNYAGYWKALEEADSLGKATGTYTLDLPAVINETAAQAMGFDDPIGERIGNFRVVGMVKDFHFRPLHHPIGPLILTNDPQNIMTMNIRMAPGAGKETLDFIRATYQKHRNGRECQISYFTDLMKQKYEEEVRLRNLTILFSVLAMIISILGILGMVVFVSEKRRHEVGIRKANGAQAWQIILLLNRGFLQWVLAAFVLAAPVAWLVMKNWLEHFAYRTALNWWIFVIAGLMAIALAAFTITIQIVRIARKNPTETLRNE
ncbi:MAG: ABC transporter permease [Bacteroidales bacterium]|nr:ABC transporter permease [Bacteroidales bacterium]